MGIGAIFNAVGAVPWSVLPGGAIFMPVPSQTRPEDLLQRMHGYGGVGMQFGSDVLYNPVQADRERFSAALAQVLQPPPETPEQRYLREAWDEVNAIAPDCDD